MPRDADSELLDIHQAARFLQVSETSLRRWTNAGQLRCLRVGLRRERRFRRADLLAFMGATLEAATARQVVETRGSARIGGKDVTFGTHLCALYDSEPALTRMASAFLCEAIPAGGYCFVVGDDAETRLIAEALGSETDVADARHNGRLTQAPYAVSPTDQLAWWESHFIQAQRQGARELRAVGVVKAFRGVARELVPEFEASFDQHIARRFPVVTMCLYDVRHFSGTAILQALKCHHDSLQYPPRHWLG